MKSPGLVEAFEDVAAVGGSGMFAHQGGWDEILLVVGPLVVVAGLLWLANRRVSAQLEATERSGPDAGGEAPEDADGSPEADPRP